MYCSIRQYSVSNVFICYRDKLCKCRRREILSNLYIRGCVRGRVAWPGWWWSHKSGVANLWVYIFLVFWNKIDCINGFFRYDLKSIDARRYYCFDEWSEMIWRELFSIYIFLSYRHKLADFIKKRSKYWYLESFLLK